MVAVESGPIFKLILVKSVQQKQYYNQHIAYVYLYVTQSYFPIMANISNKRTTQLHVINTCKFSFVSTKKETKTFSGEFDSSENNGAVNQSDEGLFQNTCGMTAVLSHATHTSTNGLGILCKL